MSVELTPQIEARIRQKVEAGGYPSADAVVDEALRLLEARDLQRQRLRDQIAEGEDGPATPVTPELIAGLRASALRRAEANEQPSDDVCP